MPIIESEKRHRDKDTHIRKGVIDNGEAREGGCKGRYRRGSSPNENEHSSERDRKEEKISSNATPQEAMYEVEEGHKQV